MRRLILAGRLDVLRSIETFCREVYLRTSHPEEAEARLNKLSLLDAVTLWRARPTP